MIFILTGLPGAGKSHLISQLKSSLGATHSFYSVDDLVASLYEQPAFKLSLERLFGTADKSQVSKLVFSNSKAMQLLLNATHSKTHEAVGSWMKTKNAIIEYPLCFEHPVDSLGCTSHKIICITADDAVRQQRVLSRPGMTLEKYKAVTSYHLAQETKSALSDLSVKSNNSLEQEKAVDSVLTFIRTNELKDRFLAHFPFPQVWEKVYAAYTEPHRKYHNLVHLQEMFQQKADFALESELAIWFHDFIYFTDQRYYENESLSANAMYSLLRGKINNKVLLGAAELIMATKGHSIRSEFIKSNPSLLLQAERFLDLDLSILLADEKRLLEYDIQIAQEFGQAPHSLSDNYSVLRKSALSTFLARDSLFHTEEFASKEHLAQANLKKLIASL